LRIGLRLVKGWGMKTAMAVIIERQRYGPFRSLSEFLQRMPRSLNRDMLENLILVGGFKSFGLTRRELLWQLGLWIGPRESLGSATVKRKQIQTELRLEDPNTAITFPDLTTAEQMVMEYRMLHFSTSSHPLSLLHKGLDSKIIFSNRLCELSNHDPVKVSGIVVARQRPASAKGYTFISLEDECGFINVVIKPHLYEKFYSTLETEPFLVVCGRLEKSGYSLNILASNIESLDVCKIKKSPKKIAENFNYLEGLRKFPPKSKNFS